MRTLTVTSWGNSEAIRLDKGLLAQAGIRKGSQLRVEVSSAGAITLTPLKTPLRARDLDELFADYDGSYQNEELHDGGPVGEELI